MTEFKEVDIPVKGYHAHIYFDDENKPFIEHLRSLLVKRYISKGDVADKYQGKTFADTEVEEGGGILLTGYEPISGPHIKKYVLCAFPPSLLSDMVTFLMFNRGPLSILIHSETGYSFKDVVVNHIHQCIWLGRELPFNWEFAKRFAKESDPSVEELFKQYYYTSPAL